MWWLGRTLWSETGVGGGLAAAILDIILCRPVSDLLLNRLLAISGIGVRTEKFRGRCSGLRSHRLEEINHGLRVVAGLVEDHRANRVGLRFVVARVLHDQALSTHLNSHLAKLPDQSSRHSSTVPPSTAEAIPAIMLVVCALPACFAECCM